MMRERKRLEELLATETELERRLGDVSATSIWGARARMFPPT